MGKSKKRLDQGQRALVGKVVQAFYAELQNGGPLLPLTAVHERVAWALGLGLRTVSRIWAEQKAAPSTANPPMPLTGPAETVMVLMPKQEAPPTVEDTSTAAVNACVQPTPIICSEHFVREDFLIISGRHRLNAGAIPSVFPWTLPNKVPSVVGNGKRNKRQESPAEIINTDGVPSHFVMQSVQKRICLPLAATETIETKRRKKDLEEPSCSTANVPDFIKIEIVEEPLKLENEDSEVEEAPGIDFIKQELEDPLRIEEPADFIEDPLRTEDPIKEEPEDCIEELVITEHLIKQEPLDLIEKQVVKEEHSYSVDFEFPV